MGIADLLSIILLSFVVQFPLYLIGFSAKEGGWRKGIKRAFQTAAGISVMLGLIALVVTSVF